ncbi:hypothetical protein KKG83_03570 [Candidatus Micrarchaeota archaeon]|nr:hypothetical protein [Candidatus Micrarchaeota archaeon]MBU2476524.1 hypothetical protein [Candidatus Micrarchaeota archaeon]
MKKIIAIALVLILIVGFTGCFQEPPKEEITKKIESDKEASDKKAEVSEDLDALGDSLKELDDELG